MHPSTQGVVSRGRHRPRNTLTGRLIRLGPDVIARLMPIGKRRLTRPDNTAIRLIARSVPQIHGTTAMYGVGHQGPPMTTQVATRLGQAKLTMPA
jgi:hypothetical protein